MLNGFSIEPCSTITTAKLIQDYDKHGIEVSKVPPVENKEMHSSGQPLEMGTKAFMEQMFCHDFSKVRVHSDSKAAKATNAVNALAYTIGQNIVFGAGQYMPGTEQGKHLLAHELTHVIQQKGEISSKGPLLVDKPNSLAEYEADHSVEQIFNKHTIPFITRFAKGPVLQGSWLGGIAGSVLGATGGALLGLAMGGPIGAVVGGLAGLVGGGILGEKATERRRYLTSPEIDYAKEVFKDTIDYSKVEITRDSLYAVGAPRTLGNIVHLKSSWNHFKENTMELTTGGKEVLIHEMGHVWQYQNGGLAYIPSSLIPQFKAWITGGDRSAAYDWGAAHNANLPWTKWKAEQQAKAIEDYNKLLRRSNAKDPTLTLRDKAVLALLEKYMVNVWLRKGAPGSGTRE